MIDKTLATDGLAPTLTSGSHKDDEKIFGDRSDMNIPITFISQRRIKYPCC